MINDNPIISAMYENADNAGKLGILKLTCNGRSVNGIMVQTAQALTTITGRSRASLTGVCALFEGALIVATATLKQNTGYQQLPGTISSGNYTTTPKTW